MRWKRSLLFCHFYCTAIFVASSSFFPLVIPFSSIIPSVLRSFRCLLSFLYHLPLFTVNPLFYCQPSFFVILFFCHPDEGGIPEMFIPPPPSINPPMLFVSVIPTKEESRECSFLHRIPLLPLCFFLSSRRRRDLCEAPSLHRLLLFPRCSSSLSSRRRRDPCEASSFQPLPLLP